MSTKTLPILDITPLLGYLPDTANGGQYIKVSEDSKDLATAIDAVVAELYDACTQYGFFYIKTPFAELPALIKEMEDSSHLFFNKDISLKKRIDMTTVGSAWRGFFSVGDEFTSGAPDIKEGIYLGSELPLTDSRVIAGLPMHGANVFPRTGEEIQDLKLIDGQHDSFKYKETSEDQILKNSILNYMEYTRLIGFAIIDGISLALELPRYTLRNILFTNLAGNQLNKENTDLSHGSTLSSLHDQEKYDPLCLFRIFNYPATKSYQDQYNKLGYIKPTDGQDDCQDKLQAQEEGENIEKKIEEAEKKPEQKEEKIPIEEKKNRVIYSVAEHTDYGCVTIIYQDTAGGLEVRDIKSSEFIPAPPLPNTLVINLGDSLEKMTNGLFVSTPHRVLNKRNGDRISFPFFFDPSFKANLTSLVPISPKLTKVFEQNSQNSQNSEQNEQNELKPQVYTHNSTYKRWDGKEIGLQGFNGTYGNYILEKVSKVFPQLAQQVELDADKPIIQ